MMTGDKKINKRKTMGNLLPVCLRGHHRRYAIVWSFAVRRNSIAFIDFHLVGIGPTLSFNIFRYMAPIILNWYHYVPGTICRFVFVRIKIQVNYWKLWFLIWSSYVWLWQKTDQVVVLTIIVFLDDQVFVCNSELIICKLVSLCEHFTRWWNWKSNFRVHC